jgi:hypothetical protein
LVDWAEMGAHILEVEHLLRLSGIESFVTVLYSIVITLVVV